MQLLNKVALVTGASTGIGQGIALRFIQEGASVVVNYRGTSPDETMGKIKEAGGTATAIQADVSKPEEVQRLIDQAVGTYQKLDIVVNNAGIEKKFPFIEYPLEEAQKIVNVNLIAPIIVSQAAAKRMIEQGHGGRIINISSVHEDLPMPTNAIYCAAKGGLRMLMRTIAVELAPHKITVNNIGPGAVFTPIDKEVQANPDIEKQLMAEIPLNRWGQPSEIGALAAFLASDDAGYITGSTYFIDGGMMRQAGSL